MNQNAVCMYVRVWLCVCVCVCARKCVRVRLRVRERVSVTTCVVRPDRYQTFRKTSILSFIISTQRQCIIECALFFYFFYFLLFESSDLSR